MNIKNRIGLIVYVHSVKQTRFLKKYGILDYVSKRMHYAVLYVDADDAEKIVTLLKKQKIVRTVEKSPLVELSASFANNQSLDDDDE
ncbi:YlbG family protein [Lactobacillus sp. Sy-1]|uniref:YlbG family protein n=1 Tax=Lactobacillus sp. Sy-1 TaxID=2109645 RepID=UPI001C580F45|nr:YlbG family protein [Lactobacillus sp. Sy-1]MBW1605444.1 YlbG family protein [Lactobacillus sp. Sy-1]